VSSIPRFFVSPADIAEGFVTFPPTDAHHARNVLRMRVGEAVVVLDGTGTAHQATLTEVSPERVVAEVTASAPSVSEPRTRITVAQALPKNTDKLEDVLQHGTEVGAAGFVVFGAQRSVAKLEENKLAKRLERWSAIVKGAAEQSGRGIVPPVSWAGNGVKRVLAEKSSQEAVFVMHEAAALPLPQALSAAADITAITFLVGPEGGFTDDEVNTVVAAGGVAVSLGPRVLRTETAALVALAQILYARSE
jgi:16S rRNA (uracil1498-N3)-methyltransferase